MTATFRLSAFGDEICLDLAEQLQTLVDLNIHRLDLRAAWGKSIVKLDAEDVARVKQTCAEYQVTVACLASPLGKSPLVAPLEVEVGRLKHLMATCQALDTRYIRVFPFYPPDISTNEHYDQHVPEVAERLGSLAQLAEKEGITLLLENEKGIVTDVPERCLAVLKAVASPALRFAWDPANFVQVGVAQPVERGWAALEPYIQYVHIKDAFLVDGSVITAGNGDGQVQLMLEKLLALDYQGVLSLEPHLQIAGHSSGFSGVDGMTLAAQALRELMEVTGCQEIG